ncbi:MAG: hypothetical protein JXB88_27120 [Spirochaetales bacterium]|nr:hypothetical protein [Spirochaetales bacterium]
MMNEKRDIKQISKALRLLKHDLKKTTELLQLLRELMHEEYILLIK